MGFFDITTVAAGLDQIEKNLKSAQDKALEMEVLKLKAQDQAPIGSRVEWGTNAMGLPTAKMVPWGEDPRIKAQQSDLLMKLQLQQQFASRAQDLETFDKLLQGTQAELAKVSGQGFEQANKLNSVLPSLFAQYQTGDPEKRAKLNVFFQSLTPELKQVAADFTTKAMGGIQPAPAAGPTGSVAIPAQGAPGIPNQGAGLRKPTGRIEAPTSLERPGADSAIAVLAKTDPAEADRRRQAKAAANGDPTAFKLKYAAMLEAAGKPATGPMIEDVVNTIYKQPKGPGATDAALKAAGDDLISTIGTLTTETPGVRLVPELGPDGKKIVGYGFEAQPDLAENPGMVESLKRALEIVKANENVQPEAYDAMVRKVGKTIKAELARYLKDADIKRSSTKSGIEVRMRAEEGPGRGPQPFGGPGGDPMYILGPGGKKGRHLDQGTQFFQDLAYLLKLSDDVSTLVVTDKKGNLIQRVVN